MPRGHIAAARSSGAAVSSSAIANPVKQRRGRPKGSAGVRRYVGEGKAESAGIDITPFLYRNAWRMYNEGVGMEVICETLGMTKSTYIMIIHRGAKPNTHRCPVCNALLRQPVEKQPCLTCAANRGKQLTETVSPIRGADHAIVLTNGLALAVPAAAITQTPEIMVRAERVYRRQANMVHRAEGRQRIKNAMNLEDIKPRGMARKKFPREIGDSVTEQSQPFVRPVRYAK